MATDRKKAVVYLTAENEKKLEIIRQALGGISKSNCINKVISIFFDINQNLDTKRNN